ncbi:hypothetical protein M8C21_014183 [Ambrosia artemisiifolia]|uniref:Uncharacterized protein n=1 Tax=Ambrosia artemisiifolia TaxID=4212 RepID=A0AAD5GCP5_AMBAR|nr:hypothetical protein M8C21_014183 [Ambrosia artemisiifolia]
MVKAFPMKRASLLFYDLVSPHHILALASEVKNLQKDKDMLRMNLIKAEAEVEALFDENNTLDEKYTRLTNLLDSEGIHSSGSMKMMMMIRGNL